MQDSQDIGFTSRKRPIENEEAEDPPAKYRKVSNASSNVSRNEMGNRRQQQHSSKKSKQTKFIISRSIFGSGSSSTSSPAKNGAGTLTLGRFGEKNKSRFSRFRLHNSRSESDSMSSPDASGLTTIRGRKYTLSPLSSPKSPSKRQQQSPRSPTKRLQQRRPRNQHRNASYDGDDTGSMVKRTIRFGGVDDGGFSASDGYQSSETDGVGGSFSSSERVGGSRKRGGRRKVADMRNHHPDDDEFIKKRKRKNIFQTRETSSTKHSDRSKKAKTKSSGISSSMEWKKGNLSSSGAEASEGEGGVVRRSKVTVEELTVRGSAVSKWQPISSQAQSLISDSLLSALGRCMNELSGARSSRAEQELQAVITRVRDELRTSTAPATSRMKSYAGIKQQMSNLKDKCLSLVSRNADLEQRLEERKRQVQDRQQKTEHLSETLKSLDHGGISRSGTSDENQYREPPYNKNDNSHSDSEEESFSQYLAEVMENGRLVAMRRTHLEIKY